MDTDVSGLGVVELAKAAIFTGPFADQSGLAILFPKDLGGSLMGVEPFDFLFVPDTDRIIREEGILQERVLSTCSYTGRA